MSVLRDLPHHKIIKYKELEKTHLESSMIRDAGLRDSEKYIQGERIRI